MRLKNRPQLFAALLLLLLPIACAELQLVDSGGDDTALPDVPEVDEDLPPELDVDDEGEPDDGEIVCETRPDAPFCPAGGSICDGKRIIACDPSCGYPAEPRNVLELCGELELCEQDGEAGSCRDCLNAEECDLPFNQCDPFSGDRQCATYNSQQTCNPDGSVGEPAPCPTGSRCVNGGCTNPSASDTAATCSANTQCGGLLCLCNTPNYSSDPNQRFYDLCQTNTTQNDGNNGPLGTGYCTTANCLRDGCEPGEICVDHTDTRQFSTRSLCIPEGTCTTRGNSCGTNRVCEEFPTRLEGEDGPRAWELGCFVAPESHIGESCLRNSECLGGRCISTFVPSVGTNVSYCSADCSSDEECPSFARCAKPPGLLGTVCLIADELDPTCGGRASEAGITTGVFAQPPGTTRPQDQIQVCYFDE